MIFTRQQLKHIYGHTGIIVDLNIFTKRLKHKLGYIREYQAKVGQLKARFVTTFDPRSDYHVPGCGDQIVSDSCCMEYGEGFEPGASKPTLHLPTSYRLFPPGAIISKLTTIQDVNLLMNSEQLT